MSHSRFNRNLESQSRSKTFPVRTSRGKFTASKPEIRSTTGTARRKPCGPGNGEDRSSGRPHGSGKTAARSQDNVERVSDPTLGADLRIEFLCRESLDRKRTPALHGASLYRAVHPPGAELRASRAGLDEADRPDWRGGAADSRSRIRSALSWRAESRGHRQSAHLP